MLQRYGLLMCQIVKKNSLCSRFVSNLPAKLQRLICKFKPCQAEYFEVVGGGSNMDFFLSQENLFLLLHSNNKRAEQSVDLYSLISALLDG